MQIDFLYYADCPSHEAALARLKAVMAETGIDAPVHITEVTTDAEAQALRFAGSPTIRIDGADIDPLPESAAYSLTCRVYRLENGRFSPLPDPATIRRALLAAHA